MRTKQIVAALLAALLGAPALQVSVSIAAQSVAKPPPVMQLAIIVRAARLRARRRHGSWLLARLREGRARNAPRGLNARPRPVARESYARGPPRRPGHRTHQ
jgi:hypothetical protein